MKNKSMNIEYEIKSTISNENVNSLLNDFPILKEGHDVDTYFDNIDGFFFADSTLKCNT
jgi:hypothetical protein